MTGKELWIELDSYSLEIRKEVLETLTIAEVLAVSEYQHEEEKKLWEECTVLRETIAFERGKLEGVKAALNTT